MHLFLCGGGSGKELQDSYHKLSTLLDLNKLVLYIPLALPNDKYDSCYEWFKEEKTYFSTSKFKMVRSNKELSKLNFNDYSMIFIGGGNTFKLLKELKEYNIENKIVNYLNDGGIIFGGSAGAIIFGKSIKTVINDDENIVDLDDLKGFNLIGNKSLLCHLNDENLLKNDELLKELSKDYKILYLNDDNVLYIHNNKEYMYGSSKYLTYKR